MFKRKSQTTPAVGSEDHMAISWAEPVPDAPYPMSAEEFERWPDDGWQYELIRGRLVRMPSSGGNSYHATQLIIRLGAYVEARGLGYVLGEQGFFRFTLPGETKANTAAPDVSFTGKDHAPERGTSAFYRPWPTVPDLALVIAAPRQDLDDKIALWLAAGVRLLWVLFPQERRAEVWLPGTEHPVEMLGMADMLDGRDVVPGFRVSVRDLL